MIRSTCGFMLGVTILSVATTAQAAETGDSFRKALLHECPDRRWNHATAADYEQPLIAASSGLSRKQKQAEDRAAGLACAYKEGLSCDNSGRIRYLMQHSRLRSLMQAFCVVQPSAFD